MYKKIGKNYGDHLYFISRVLVGFLFFSIGAQRFLGWFGGEGNTAIFSLAGLGGIIEFVGGIAIAVGFFVRPVALISAIYMLIEYIRSHAVINIYPLATQGGVEYLLFALFLIFIVDGAKKWSLEKALLKKERF